MAGHLYDFNVLPPQGNEVAVFYEFDFSAIGAKYSDYRGLSSL